MDSVHLKNRTFECYICKAKHSSSKMLLAHITTHNIDGTDTSSKCGKPYYCETCGKCFSQKSNVKQHIEDVHVKTKKFSCEVCDKRFSQKVTLTEHMRVHSGERLFVCEACGKSFSRKSALTRHMEDVHEKSRHYQCEVCHKIVANASNLNRHRKTHTS